MRGTVGEARGVRSHPSEARVEARAAGAGASAGIRPAVERLCASRRPVRARMGAQIPKRAEATVLVELTGIEPATS